MKVLSGKLRLCFEKIFLALQQVILLFATGRKKEEKTKQNPSMCFTGISSKC